MLLFGTPEKAEIFTSRAVGIFVESKAAQMGSTSGGASQLLKTRLSYTFKVTETKYPNFTLNTGYPWRGLIRWD